MPVIRGSTFNENLIKVHPRFPYWLAGVRRNTSICQSRNLGETFLRDSFDWEVPKLEANCSIWEGGNVPTKLTLQWHGVGMGPKKPFSCYLWHLSGNVSRFFSNTEDQEEAAADVWFVVLFTWAGRWSGGRWASRGSAASSTWRSAPSSRPPSSAGAIRARRGPAIEIRGP